MTFETFKNYNMSEELQMSPASLFARIESLKKWQTEQQQRLLEQQSQQTNFLSREHQRMYEALGIKQLEEHNFIEECESESYEEDSGNIEDETKLYKIDEIPIKSPGKDFHVLLEEKLKDVDVPVIKQQTVKPKQCSFLKKGSGLSRFRMTVDDLAHKKPKPKVAIINNKKSNVPNKTGNKKIVKKSTDNDNKRRLSTSKSTENVLKPNANLKPTPSILNVHKKEYVEPKLSWKSVQQETPSRVQNHPSNYQALLAELLEVRQRDPSIFDSPITKNKSTENSQFSDQDLSNELKIFETLEQKVLNNSFCSTSSFVTRLMEQPINSTPQKKIHFASLLHSKNDHPIISNEVKYSPKRSVSFADTFQQTPQSNMQDIEEEEETTEESEDETSDDTNSTINSDDISDSPVIQKSSFQRLKYKDVATNTNASPINSELLKSRLIQLENEIETFRAENARMNKLKSQYETDSRNLEKQKTQFKKEMEERRQQMKQELDEEKAKLAKDRQVYDRYAREIKDGKSLRQKDKEEISVLRGQVTTLKEEIKLKESKWGATQARLRNQLRHLEKENVNLRTENNELRTKNGKLEATNKQLLSRKPSETKVLHEINKNLSKLTQDNKAGKSTIKKLDETNTINKRNRTSSISAKATTPTTTKRISFNNNSNKENQNSFNSSSLSESNKSSTDRSFESVEREYEKIFGNNSSCYHNDDKNETVLPAAETSIPPDISCRVEEKILEDGSRQIKYPNGNLRTISANGQTIVTQYHNGDTKEICKETGTIRYLYSDAGTWHTTYPDGLELLEFSNGQIEKRFSNGATEILFPNGCQRCTSPSGTEEVTFSDGTILIAQPSTGEKILKLPNGQKEIHTTEHKRREYPDGTVKIVYPDGIQETRYANGRIRLKDKDGHLIMDSATD